MKYLGLSILMCVSLTFSSTLVAKEDVNLTTKVRFEQNLPDGGNLILGIYENGELGVFGKQIDAATNGGLSYVLKATDFKAEKNERKIVTAPQGSGLDEILLVGLGDIAKTMSAVQWQDIAGNAVQEAVKAFKEAPAFALDAPAEHSAYVAFGAKLGSYYFDKYQTDPEAKKTQEQLTIGTSSRDAARDYYKANLDSLATGIWYARNISNEPANIIYPESFVARWRQHFKGLDNIKIRVLDEDDMLDKNMGAIYGVGRGSDRPPRMLIVEYRGGERGQAPVAIVGKGITFDTGGISIKPPPNMWNMKFDMSGAASTMGTIYALAGREAKVNVVGIAALAENMPGGNAQRPGDVVTTMSGKTIQIRSTDAEGRLVLADAVHYADVTYNPPLLIDLATLTGSARRALGGDYGALFARDGNLAAKMFNAGTKSGDKVWHLPLNEKHFKAIKNNVADVMNSGPTAPGASAGAAFIGSFIRESTPWVHIDIAGVAYSDEPTPTKASPGSASFGVRLLNTYIKEHFEQTSSAE